MFTERDRVQVANLQKYLGKAKAELEGNEVLAAADVMVWVSQLKARIDAALKPVPAAVAAVDPIDKKAKTKV